MVTELAKESKVEVGLKNKKRKRFVAYTDEEIVQRGQHATEHENTSALNKFKRVSLISGKLKTIT